MYMYVVAVCILFTGIETFGKNAVVCGRSKNVGMPIMMLLHADGVYETQAGGYILHVAAKPSILFYIYYQDISICDPYLCWS